VAERGELVELYNATAVGEELAPSYHVAPTTQVYGVVAHRARDGGEAERHIRSLSPLQRLIDARVETLAERPYWAALPKRRGICPAHGYNEWAPGGG
jgi:putative SOS response-associated peptidase YedK